MFRPRIEAIFREVLFAGYTAQDVKQIYKYKM